MTFSESFGNKKEAFYVCHFLVMMEGGSSSLTQYKERQMAKKKKKAAKRKAAPKKRKAAPKKNKKAAKKRRR